MDLTVYEPDISDIVMSSLLLILKTGVPSAAKCLLDTEPPKGLGAALSEEARGVDDEHLVLPLGRLLAA